MLKDRGNNAFLNAMRDMPTITFADPGHWTTADIVQMPPERNAGGMIEFIRNAQDNYWNAANGEMGQWQTVKIGDISNPDDDYWPEKCVEIAPKPQTREGIDAFFSHHPELRGVS